MKTPPREVEPDPSFTYQVKGWGGGWRVKGGRWRVEGGGWRVEASADLSTRSCLRYRLHTLYAIILTTFMRL